MGNTMDIRSRVRLGTGTGSGLPYPHNTVPFSTVLWVFRYRDSSHVTLLIMLIVGYTFVYNDIR